MNNNLNDNNKGLFISFILISMVILGIFINKKSLVSLPWNDPKTSADVC